MPRLDGRQFRAAQRYAPGLAGIPVVVVSADPRVAEQAALLGADDYLRKPVEPDALFEVLRHQC